MKPALRIGTRASQLSLWQANHVRGLLQAVYPDAVIELKTYRTRGDDLGDAPLPEIGGKGLFTSALERGLRAGEIDCAVHSLKDLPTEPDDDIVVGAVPKRGDPRDALVSRDGHTLAQLPKGAHVGTGSRRRRAQLLRLRPDLVMRHIRGNVPTRLQKLMADDSGLDAIVLAVAGLHRLAKAQRISQVFTPVQMVCAAGQGALAVQCRRDKQDLFAPLDDANSRLAVTAERAFLAGLGAGCSMPAGAFAVADGQGARLRCRVIALDGSRQIEVRLDAAFSSGDKTRVARQLGASAAEEALRQGANALLQLEN